MIATAFSGCSPRRSTAPEEPLYGRQTEQIAFEGTDSEYNIRCFTVISDSGISTLEFLTDGNERHDFFRKYEKDSVAFEKKLSGGEIYDSFVFDTENNCYYAYDPIGTKIKRLDENFEYLSDIVGLEAFEIKGMDIVGDFLYVLSVAEDPYDRGITENENGYADLGEKAYRINTVTGSADEINVKNPICQFCDGSSVYYYTCENGKYAVKRLDNDILLHVSDADDTGYIVSFILFGEQFIYSMPDLDDLYLKNNGSGIITTYANGSYCLNGTDMRLYKGNLLFLNRNIMQVEKLYLGKPPETGSAGAAMKFAGKELVVYGDVQSNRIRFPEMKEATGITATIYQDAVTDEQMLLKLMARDSDIDIFNFYSSRPIGKSVRKNGAYEPLNGCEKIKEFLSRCHGYISDFCTDENGDIWAVPVSAETMAVFYVPRNTESLGLSYKNNFEMYPDFLDTLRQMTNQDKFDHYGNMEDISADIFEAGYNVNYSFTDYHTDVFKELFEKTRGGYPRYSVSPFFKDFYKRGGTEFNTEKTAFKVDYISSHMMGAEPLETWRVFPSPKVCSPEDKSPVILSYLVVNPYSRNIDAAKEYLSVLAEDFLHMTNKFSPVYKDIEEYSEDHDISSPAFRDIFGISENAAVYEPICSTDNAKYLTDYHDGKITVDEVVQELERRAEIALNE